MPKPIFQTLRFRLTFWNTIVLLLASLLALLAVREGMRLTLVNETRDLLREETTELELAVRQLYPEIEEIKSEFMRKIQGHSQHSWFAELRDGQRQTLWRSASYPGLDDFAVDIADKQPFQFKQNSDVILVEHPFELADGKQFVILLGTPTEFIRRDVWNLTQVMLAIGTVLFLIAPWGGYLLARNATQPVREIIETTRRLDPANLGQRLLVRGTDDELDQISTEINSFLDQISKYLQSHREFIANAAHELRSPLTAIQTSVDVVLEKNRSAEEYRDEMATISEQCEELRHLVNQLLQLAETDTADRRNRFATVDLSELVAKSMDVFSGVAEEQNVALNADLGMRICVHGDESKLRQVVNNLLDNALKFTPAGGEVKLSLSKSIEAIHFHVADTGCGIPANEISRIFDRFYQVDHSRDRASRHGNGLGLSICKSIVEMHGGTIQVANLNPHGAEVRVLLQV